VAAGRGRGGEGVDTSLKLTLDTNCLIDLEEQRDGSDVLRDAIDSAVARGLSIGILGISASEKRLKSSAPLGPAELKERLVRHGLDSAEILKPLGFCGLTFWDFCVFGSEEAKNLHERIADILFGNSPYRYNRPDEDGRYQIKHRNQICDCQAIWAHISYSRDVFVTNDGNFYSKSYLLEKIGVNKIVKPIEIAFL
jgi:hypothetical protein